jgi:hypothetical protein
MRDPLSVHLLFFAVNSFLEVIGSGNQIADRLCAFNFFRNLNMQTFYEIMAILPEEAIEVISDSFIELDLAADSDKFLGLLSEIVLLWKNHPARDIRRLIDYLESMEPSDLVDTLLDVYYEDLIDT